MRIGDNKYTSKNIFYFVLIKQESSEINSLINLLKDMHHMPLVSERQEEIENLYRKVHSVKYEGI